MKRRDRAQRPFASQAVARVEAIARELAASSPHELREEVFAQARLHGLSVVRGAPDVSAQRLRQLMDRHVRRWLAKWRRASDARALVPEPEDQAIARAAVRELPMPYAAVAWRCLVEGASIGTVAEETGLADPLVRYLLDRAVDLLAGKPEHLGQVAGELAERAFVAEVRSELARAKRRGHSVGLIVLRGPASPAAQRRAMEIVVRSVRALDIVGWLDGWPAVVMPHLSTTAAPEVALRIASAAAAATQARWQAGWALRPDDGQTLPALLAAAERRLAPAAADDLSSRAA